jgi:hypothetical protein
LAIHHGDRISWILELRKDEQFIPELCWLFGKLADLMEVQVQAWRVFHAVGDGNGFGREEELVGWTHHYRVDGTVPAF